MRVLLCVVIVVLSVRGRERKRWKREVMVVLLSAGTLMELGISPIVTSSLIMQVSK